MVINSHNTPHSSVDTNATTSRHDIGVEEMIQHSMMIKRKNNETRERLLNMTQERENDVELSHSNVKEELRDTETDGVSVPGDHEMIPSGSNTPLDPLKTERRSPGAGAKDGEIHPSLPPIENTISPEKHDGGWTWGTTRPSIYIRDGQHDRAAPETNARAFKNAEQQHAEREIQREQNRRRDHLSEEENQVRLVDDQNESRHEQSKEAITHQPAAVSEPKNPKESEQLNEVIEKDEQPLFEGFLSDHDIDFEQFDHEDYIPPGMVEELGLTDFSPEDWLRSTMVDETGLEHYSPKEVTRDERPTSGNNSDLHHRRSAQMLVSRSSSETRFPASQASASNFVRSRASSTSSFGISAPGIMASHGEGPQRFQEIDVDSDSGISSYAASVLSVQSLASSATDISKGSGYSPHQIATATKELVTIFQEDTFLVSLYKSAINDSSIGPEKLQRNLRRLFKQFAEHLKGEAKDSLEYLASRLVSLKARFLAQSIVQEFSGRIASPAKDLEADHESSEDEEEEQSSTVDDAAFDDLVVFREFLVGSDAFSTLRAQIQNFAVPKTAQAQRKFLIGTKSLPETAAPDVEDEVQRIRDLLATRDSVQPGMQIDWGMIGRSRKNTEHVLQAAKASLENYQSNNRLPPKESNHRQATRTTDSFVLPSIIVAVIFGIQEDVFGFEKHPVSFVLATFALFILAGISRVLTFWFWTYVLERAYGQKLQPSNPLVSKQYDAVGIFSSNPSDDSPAVGRDRIWNKLSTKIGSWQAKLKNVSSKHFHALLIAFGCFESALEPGKVRLRWRCGCGDSFIGDFTEHQASGISNMATHMERLTGAKVTSITSHSENTAPKTTGQHPGLWLRNAMESLGSLVNKRSKQRTLPQHTPNTAVGTSTPGHGSQQGQMLHLLSCLHAGRFRKTLAQDRIESFKTDRQLFYFIRDQYRVHRGRIKGLLSLKTVKGIYFTKFRLPMGGSVELRAHNPCCIQPHVCECLPPPSRVEPSKDAEYRCEPVPSSVWPPIDPHYLSHLFKDPTCINENDTWILDQLPKRTRGELQGKVGKPADGWGIYYEEGWDRDIITLVVVLLFIVSSLVFGVTWSYFKMDVQGAFGVSSYMMASCAAMISFVAMKMDKA
ncbi:unnamed protein product [Periconia digitata]|uniref:Uncharacterized protein n=1 Tax=Periconia digitata TaxID=1303443 RepID=A0A9W4UGC8_9PLEO|nr:unnamed protein product [Periconia digitata]